jgi:predicted DNA-binding transcriptional regulator AlpA
MLALLTQREAAELLRLNERTLIRLRVAGTGPKYIRIGRTKVVRYRPEDVQSWLASKLISSTSEEPELPRPLRNPKAQVESQPSGEAA